MFFNNAYILHIASQPKLTRRQSPKKLASQEPEVAIKIVSDLDLIWPEKDQDADALIPSITHHIA